MLLEASPSTSSAARLVIFVTSFHFFFFPYLAAEAGADLSAPVTQWFQPNVHKTCEPPTCFHYDFWTLL